MNHNLSPKTINEIRNNYLKSKDKINKYRIALYISSILLAISIVFGGLIVKHFLIILIPYTILINRTNQAKRNIAKYNKHIEQIENSDYIGNTHSQNNLTANDLKFFNQIEKSILKNIKIIQKAMEQSTVIHSILHENNRISSIQIFYLSLKERPEQLINADSFVHTDLPYLTHLIQEHALAEQTNIKSKHTINLLRQSEIVIGDLADEIVRNYIEYQNNKDNQLEHQINISKAHLNSKKP